MATVFEHKVQNGGNTPAGRLSAEDFNQVTAEIMAINASKGAPNGIAALDAAGKVPYSSLQYCDSSISVGNGADQAHATWKSYYFGIGSMLSINGGKFVQIGYGGNTDGRYILIFDSQFRVINNLFTFSAGYFRYEATADAAPPIGTIYVMLPIRPIEYVNI